MCDYGDSPGGREAAMIVLDPGTPERQGRDGVWCDPCIAPIVKALNEAGIPTVASCCGHGERPGNIALRDGRELILAKDFQEGRSHDGHWEYDEVIFGDEDEAPVELARRWVGKWSRVDESELDTANAYYEDEILPSGPDSGVGGNSRPH